MKKIFFIILLFLFSFGLVSADSGESMVSWGENTLARECVTSFSHGVTHYGVPVVNARGVGKSGTLRCITHTYSKKTYTVPVTGELTACKPGDRAVIGTVAQNVQNCKEVTKQICDRGDGRVYKEENGNCFFMRINFRGVKWIKIGYQPITTNECSNETVQVPANSDLNTKKTFITCERYDDTPPKVDDITYSFNNTLDVNNSNPGFIRANNHNITFSIKKELETNGANIAQITAKVENVDNSNAWDRRDRTGADLNTNYFDKYSEDFNFTKVDGPDRNHNNFREYQYVIEDICDEAGNCLTHTGQAPKVFKYNVYANYIDNGKSSITKPTQPGIANGQQENYNFNLKDRFGNTIVPVKNASTQIRDLNFEFKYNNYLNLDQYNKTGSGIHSSKFYNGTNAGIFTALELGANKKLSTAFNQTSIKNGEYKFSLKPYSPTYKANATDGRQYVIGSFTSNGTSVKLSDKVNDDSLLNSKNLQYIPLYYTSIDKGIAEDNIIVGARQDTDLIINKNTSSVDSQYKQILLEYGYFDNGHKEHKNFELKYNEDKGENFTKITGKKSDYNDLTKLNGKNISPQKNNLSTNLVQKGKIDEKQTKTYLATFVKNTFAGGIVSVYPSFVQGMTSYYGTVKDFNTFQRPLKIIGNTHSLYYTDVTADEVNKNIKLLGDLDKSALQKNVRKIVFDDTRNLNLAKAMSEKTLTNFGTTSTNDYKIVGNTIYFSNLNGNIVKISLTNPKYSGIKNIVIHGGNAYITKNIEATDKTKDIVSILAVAQDGKGGDIFIDPAVTRLDTVLYADRSISSYKDGKILTPKNGGTYDLLKNQLHIYGSLFSNNTIGGSIKADGSLQSTPQCPYYVKKSDCTVDEAQKYDLYNLRRGYENILTNPKNYNSNLKIGYTGDVRYPVIIEYNPIVQKVKIPFFEIKK